MAREKLNELLKKASNPVLTFILRQALSLFAGMLLSYSGNGFSYSPLGVAFVCAVKEKYRISSSVGAALGYIMYCGTLNALRYIAAILCAYVLSRLLSAFDITGSSLSMGLISAFCIFSTGLALSFAEGLGAKLFSSSAAEAVFSLCACYVMSLIFSQLEIRPSLKGITLREFMLFSFGLSFILWSFHGFSFPVFYPGAVAIFYLTLLLPELYSGFGSLVLSAVSCAVFSVLSEGTVLPFGFILGAAACTVAYFSSSQVRFRSLFLLLSSLLLFFLRLGTEGSYIAEAATAAIFFAVTPSGFRKNVIEHLKGSNEPIYDNAIKKGLSAQLHLASSAVGEISNAVTAVSAGLDRGAPSARGEVFSRVTGELCSSCPSFEHCWLEDREKTVRAFDSLFKQLRENEYIDYQNMSIDAKTRCIKGFQLARTFNGAFQNFNVDALSRKERAQMRRSVAEQFYSVGDIIDDIAESFEENFYPDGNLSERVRLACFSFGITPRRAVCKTSETGQLKIEIECEEIKKEFSRTLFKERLEAVCSKKLEMPVTVSGEQSDFITVCEKCPLAVEVGSSQITADGESVCGDSFEHFFDGRGAFDVVLSDGMGTGARAALDSAMTRGLTGTLLKKGISPRGTLKLVNSALIAKSPEESMSTLDIMQVDMFSGKAQFFKAGATSSFVRHKGRIQEIKKAALPLGILHRVEFASMKGNISDGDIAVMVSDGVADCGADMIREIIRKNAVLPSEEIAQKLTASAEKVRGEKHDDLTAVVCKFF